jgi:cobalamin-dependent methionine synthase I
VSTSKQMPLCVQELDRRGLQLPVLIGGAAINRRFGRRPDNRSRRGISPEIRAGVSR